MDTSALVAQIDSEIARLQTARAAIADLDGSPSAPTGKRRGRPKGSTNAPAKKAKRKMSAEGKARIAAAQKKRWAASKKAAKKTTPSA
jgi:hypothetical protein